MPTNRKRTPRSRKVSQLNQGEINFLYDRDEPLDSPWTDHIFMSDSEIQALWENNRDEVLTWWIENQPCTRPGPWWKYNAPKELVSGCDGSEFFAYQAFRLRLGGTGTPNHEVLAYCPSFILGVPDSWTKQRDADYYNGRAKDIHGNPIGNNKEGDFSGVAINADDPPLYESQAVYLQRHGLLTKEEEKHLKKNPELLAAEEITA